MKTDSPYLTVAEAAEYLRRKESTVRAWLTRRRDFPQLRVGRSVLIPRAQLELWIMAQNRSSDGTR
jgi:excisionase family DNA binding protein